MEKLDLFKKILFQIVGENDSICNELRVAMGGYPLEIEVNGTNGHEAHYDSFCDRHYIILGLDKLPCLYKLCQEISYLVKNGSVIKIRSEYSDFGNEDIHDVLSIWVANAIPPTPNEILGHTDFLKNEMLTQNDTLTIFALSYVLYHEIGHVLYDRNMENSKQIEKERKADEFAFEAIKSMCNGNDKETDKARFLGVFIGIAHILLIRTPQEEREDKKHPHIIERLYNLLVYWGVQDDSYYWELAYNVVFKWCQQNELSMLWEKETSISPKDKFMDAYTHFRKNS